MSRHRFVAILLLGDLLLVSSTGCGGSTARTVALDGGSADSTASTCIPGQRKPCTCSGPSLGSQVCNASGSAYGQCEGCPGPTDSAIPPDGAEDARETDSGDAGTSVPDAAAEASTYCQTSDWCLSRQACDPATHTCSSMCSATQRCRSGCCQNGTCVLGMVAAACGNDGWACTDCSTQSQCGSSDGGTDCLCFYGQCTPPDTTPANCSTATDCALGQACDLTANKCTPQCGSAQQSGCNSGCCLGGLCTPGVDDQACGSNGSTCVDCSASCSNGPACVTFGGASICACSTNAQCASAICGSKVSCSANSCL